MFITISLTLLITFVFLVITAKTLIKTEERDTELLFLKIKYVLKDEKLSLEERVEEVKYICRNSKLKAASGAYFAIDEMIKVIE